METESIIINYKIKSKQIKDSSTNATRILIERNKELFLFDILLHFMTINVGVNYTFAARALSNFVPLYSPSSIVPVVDRQVHLILTPSDYPPVVPLHQAQSFYDLSRDELYSGCESSDASVQPYPSSGRNTNTYASEVNALNSYKDNAHSAYDRGSDLPPKSSFPRPPRASANTNPEPEHSFVGMADAAKLATENVTKSLFSFAQKSLKVVSEAIDNAKNTSSATMSMSQPIQVGRHQVTISREIAEG